MQILVIICWSLALLISLPLLVLGVQCFVALLPSRKPTLGERRSVALLVPAHNEAACILETLAAIRPQLAASDRVVVIADNCTDDTAKVAREAGAEVVERFDPSKRGKGYALDAGVRFLEQLPPDVVIIFDADCQADEGMVDQLSRVVDSTQRPAQALYLMRPPNVLRPEAAVSSFAFLMKNWVRPRALHRLGIPVLLTGTGMAFPWEIIRQAALASGEIVEDIALGLTLIRQGCGPQFCENARVWSQLPNSTDAAVSQRTRWEHGYLSAMLHHVPRMLLRACTGRPILIAVALDMLVPPVSMLVMLASLCGSMIFFFSLWTNAWYPLGLLLSVGLFAALGICCSWFRFARELIPLNALTSIPGYVFSKISLYFRFVVQRETHWVRTKRDNE